jgi:hypothetical protein
MRSCAFDRNPQTDEIVNVYAPNGQPSKLYQAALNEFPQEPRKALQVWSIAYTNKFKQRYGDWQNGTTHIPLDENGEPTIDTVFYTRSAMTKILRNDFSHWYEFQPGEEPWHNEEKAKRFAAALRKKFPDMRIEFERNYSMQGKVKIKYVPAVKEIGLRRYTKEEIEAQKRIVNPIMDNLVAKFKGLTYEWVKPGKLNQDEHYENVDNIRSFVRNNKIYLVEGRVIPEDAIEEVMHVFVEMLRTDRKPLFMGLFNMLKEDPRFEAMLKNLQTAYANNKRISDPTVVIQSEFIAKNLAIAMKNELSIAPEGRRSPLANLIQRFFDWLSKLLNMEKIDGKTTLATIAQTINVKGAYFDTPEVDPYLYYSATPDVEGANFNPEDREETQKLDPINKKKTARELNIEKAEKEIEKIANMRKKLLSSTAFRKTAAQLEVIKKLEQNVKDKLEWLKGGGQTIGVTKYIGSEDTEMLDSFVAELGANFGNFYHYLLEELQEEYINTGKAPIIIMSDPAFFDNFFKKNERLIKFSDFDKDTLRNAALELAGQMSSILSDGKIILPEISIAVQDLNGNMVLGRLDLMAVDKNGNIEVIDLKTKSANKYPIGSFPMMAFTTKNFVKGFFKDGANYLFSQIKDRSALDKYHMQLAVYSEMLRKLNINVNGRTVWALAYKYDKNAEDPKDNKMIGYKIATFRDYDFFGQVDPADQPAMSNGIEMAARQSFRELDQMTDNTTLPGEGKMNPFASIDPSIQDMMLERFDELAKNQFEVIASDVRRISEDKKMPQEEREEKINMLKRRQQSLVSLRESIKKDFSSESSEAIRTAKALLIKTAFDVFTNEIEMIVERVKAIDVPKTFELGTPENQVALGLLQYYNRSLGGMSESIQMFGNTIQQMEDLDPQTKREISQMLHDMREGIAEVENKNGRVGRRVIIAIMKATVGTQSLKVFGEMSKLLEVELQYLEKQIQKMESGQLNPESMTYNALRRLKNLLGSDKPLNTTKLEDFKKRAEEIRQMIAIKQFDDKTIDMYLDGILNSGEHVFYMGSTVQGANGLITMDSIIGDNANSEAIVAAMWKYMYNITERSRVEMLRWAESLGIDKLKQDIIDSLGGITEANKFFSEEIEVDVYDENGNVTGTETVRVYADPAHSKFYKEHDNFTIALRTLNKKIDEINRKLNQGVEEAEAQTLRQERDKLNEQQRATYTAFTEWKIEKTNTILKPEVMRLQLQSGSQIAEISAIRDKISSIVKSVGSDAYLDDMQQEIIDDLESQMSRILQEIRDKDPQAMERYKELDEYYTFRLNYNLWEKKRTAIRNQGDPKLLERFDMNNTDMTPTAEYTDRVNEIFERIAELKSQDPVMQDIRERMNKLRSKAYVRGKFNYKFLNEQEIAEYESLEDELELRKEELRMEPDDMLTDDEKMELNDLFSELASMRTKVLRTDFARDFNNHRDRVIKSYNYLQELNRKRDNLATVDRTLLDQIADAEKQYMNHEKEFASFFNKHSNTKYVVGKDTLAKGGALNEKWRSHLYTYMPSDPNMMEMVPNKKYKIKILKDAAYNPDYQDSFVKNKYGRGFYPMPKGIRFNKDTNMFDITNPKGEYVNPKFMQILANPKAKEFYSKWIVENFLLKQREASGTPLGFRFPNVQQLGFDNLVTKGMTGVAREIQEKAQEVHYAGSEFEKATNESGMAGNMKILFKENYPMAAELTTTNGIEAIVNWNAGFYLNKQLTFLDIYMSSSLNYLEGRYKELVDKGTTESLNNANKLRTMIEQIKFNRDKFVFGQIYEKSTDESKTVLNRKNMRILMQIGAWGRMAFDASMQVGNLLSGNIQGFLSTSASRHATEADYFTAKKLLYGKFFPAMLADWGKISDASFETKLIRYLNPLAKNLDRVMDANTAGKARRLANRVFNVGDLAMIIQDKGEVEIGVTTALMILVNRRYEMFETDPDGNVIMENGTKKLKKNADGSTVMVNGMEAFKLKNNSIHIREDVNLSEREVEDLKVLILTEIYRFQGNYSQATKSKFGSTIWGSLFEYYRKYLIPAISARFQGAFSDTYKGVGSSYGWSTEEAYMGWWVGTWRFFQYHGFKKGAKTFLLDGILSFPGLSALGSDKLKKSINTGIETSDPYRAKAAQTAREVLLAYLGYHLYMILRAMIYDEDRDDLSWGELQLYRALIKTTNETRSMVPVPIVGKPLDYIDQFGQFTTAFKEVKTMGSLMTNGLWYINYNLTGDEGAYENGFYQRNAGHQQKGDAKVIKNFQDITGFSNIVDMYDPYFRAKEQAKQKY